MSYPGYGGPPAWSGNGAYPYPPYGEYYARSQYAPPLQPGPYGYEYGPQGPIPYGNYPHGPGYPPPSVFEAPHSHYSNSHLFQPHPSSLHPPGYHAPQSQGRNAHGSMPSHHLLGPHQAPPYETLLPSAHQLAPQAFSAPSNPLPPAAFEGRWQQHPPHPASAWNHSRQAMDFSSRHEWIGQPRNHPVPGSWRKPSPTIKPNSAAGNEALEASLTNEDGSLRLNAGNLKELQEDASPTKPSDGSSPDSSAMKIESQSSSPAHPHHGNTHGPPTIDPNYSNDSKQATTDPLMSSSTKNAEPVAPHQAKVDAQQPTASASPTVSNLQEANDFDSSASSRPAPWCPDQPQVSLPKHALDTASLSHLLPAPTSISKPSSEDDESVASDDSYSPPPLSANAPIIRHSPGAALSVKPVTSHLRYNGLPQGINGFHMFPPPPPPPPPPPFQPPPPPPGSPPGGADIKDRPCTPNWGISDKQLRGTPPVSSIEEDASLDSEVEGGSKAPKQSAFDLSYDRASENTIQSSDDKSIAPKSKHANEAADSEQTSSPKANTPKSESGMARKRKREEPDWERKMRMRSARRYIL